MKTQQASRTAEFMALFRALESVKPEHERLFDDPLAASFLAPTLQAVVTAARLAPLHALITKLIDQRWPGARTSGVARTRLIDEWVCQSLAEGIEQVVLLGAGFDSRVYRIPQMDGIQTWEVDHPTTSKLKRQHVQRLLRAKPYQVAFVEIDFNRQELGKQLAAAGFDAARSTFFVWEGVTNYLSEAAVDSTLKAVSSVKPGSKILFTYIDKEVLEHPDKFDRTQTLSRLLKRVGERWTFGFDPKGLPQYLRARGLELMQDVGSVEYRARYMGSNGHHLKGYEFYRAALARVIEPSTPSDKVR